MNSMKDCYTLRNGVRIPCIGFGTWQTPDGDIAANSVREAITCGYRHIDTAAVYGNEESVGRGIRESGVSRDDLFITTKVWNTDHGYEETLRAFDASMERLQLDYCDLYLIHWPAPAAIRNCWKEKNAETWRAMEKLYQEGRIRAIGLSNFWPHHIDALLETAVIMPMVNQIRLNPTDQHVDVASYSQKLGMLLEAYSPLGTGDVLSQPEIIRIAQKYKKSAAQVCVRWSLQMGYLPMPKSITSERIRNNAMVFDFTLDEGDMSLLATMENRLGPSNHPDKVNF